MNCHGIVLKDEVVGRAGVDVEVWVYGSRTFEIFFFFWESQLKIFAAFQQNREFVGRVVDDSFFWGKQVDGELSLVPCYC